MPPFTVSDVEKVLWVVLAICVVVGLVLGYQPQYEAQ